MSKTSANSLALLCVAVYMNWSVVLVGGIVIISAIWWFIDGRKNYVGPNIEATLHRNMD